MCGSDQTQSFDFPFYPGGDVLKNMVCWSSMVLAALACNRGGDSNQDTTHAAQTAQTPGADARVEVRGTVVSVSPNQLVIKSDTSTVNVNLT